MQKKNNFYIATLFLVWSIVTSINIFQGYLWTYVAGQTYNWKISVPWSLGWLLWIPLTPLAFYIVKRVNDKKFAHVKQIIVYAFYGIGFVILFSLLEFGLMYFSYSLLNSTAPPIERFLSFVPYKMNINFLVYAGVVSFKVAVDSYKKSKEIKEKQAKLEADLLQAELNLLNSQIQPHFLFNTHHTIIGLIMKKDYDNAIDMLNGLSDLLRMTIERSKKPFISIKEEIEFTDAFLKLHKKRFGERFDYNFNVDENISNLLIPSLVLQPLAENAIKHGVEQTSDKVIIDTSITANNNHLFINMKNSGPKLNGNFSDGVGLSNIKSRLNRLYNHNFEFQEEFLKEGGFSVKIEIPMNNSEL